MDTKIEDFRIRKAEKRDVPLIHDFISKLAEYERLTHEMVATHENLEKYLFGEERAAEVVIGYYREVPVGFALYFFSFSTFLARPGIYLEDLFVLEEYRGMGFGKILLSFLARLAVQKGYGRLEWAVLDWNEPSIAFYKSLGAITLDEWVINRMTGEALIRLAEQF